MKKQIFKKTQLMCILFLALSFIAKATIHTVTVQNFSFSPSSVNAMVSDTILWTWASGSHTTTSTSVPAGAATWNQSMNSSSTTFQYVITVAGTYNYKCTPHASSGMTGTINATNPTGINQVTKSEPSISFYPNPVNDKLFINLKNFIADKGQIIIYDVLGREINRQQIQIYRGENEYALNVTDLRRGFYFVKVLSAERLDVVMKIIKQ